MAQALSLVAAHMKPDDAAELLIRALERETDPFAPVDLSSGLVSVAGRMEAPEAFRMLVGVLKKSAHDEVRGKLVKGLSSAADRMEPNTAMKLCDPLARMLAKELATELANNKDLPLNKVGSISREGRRVELFAPGLSALASRLEPREASGLCGPVAQALATMIERNPGNWPIPPLAILLKLIAPAQARELCGRIARSWAAGLETVIVQRRISELTSIADWLDPAAANELFSRAGRVLSATIENETDDNVRNDLTSELIAVASRMEPTEGAKFLMAIVSKPRTYPTPEFACAIAWLARRMMPSEAEKVCRDAMSFYLKERGSSCSEIAYLICKINREKAHDIALELARLMCSDWRSYGSVENKLHYALSDSDRLPWVPWSPWRIEYGGWKDSMKSDKSSRCRLTSQELVSLLKMPTCIGQTRRVVLDHLGNIHGRRFANHWSFVRFAHETGLQVDLTTPPRRPNPEESIKRMLAILDGKS